MTKEHVSTGEEETASSSFLDFSVVIPVYSVLQVTDFLNAATAPDSLIETYDSELFFLLQRPYHYPPNQIHIELNRRHFLRENVPINYDPLAADPDYLVVGSQRLSGNKSFEKQSLMPNQKDA